MELTERPLSGALFFVMPSSPSPAASEPDAKTDILDPAKIHVVDIECEQTGNVFCWDCYDPLSQTHSENGDSRQSVFRIVDDTVYLRTINWARSASPDAEACVEWRSTGLSPDEVTRIRVHTWPRAKPDRTFQYRM